MRNIRLFTATALAAGTLFTMPPAALAQQSQEWFVPGGQQQQRPAQGRAGPAARPRQPAPTPAPPAAVPIPSPAPPMGGEPQQAPPLAQFQLPPEPALPPVSEGKVPPAAVIGVLGVPDVMRACSAYQEIERVIGQRRQKLNEDVQKEQTAWRDLQQQLASQRSGLGPEQIRARERELQERITSAQGQFKERNRVIQEAAQFALAQIERTLVGVIRQVAESRRMNLVLHRNQVALNTNEFDLTDQVTAQLNKVLPNVVIPADGQEPPTVPLAQAPAGPPSVAANGTPPAGAAPAPASASNGGAPSPQPGGPALSQPTGQPKP